jgi:hypothetical protein
LVSNEKATTFAPALREKHCSVEMLKKRWNSLLNYFPKKFGSLEISITFAAAFRGKVINKKLANK